MKTKRLAALGLCLAILMALLPNLQLSALADGEFDGSINFPKSITVGQTFTVSWSFTGGDPEVIHADLIFWNDDGDADKYTPEDLNGANDSFSYTPLETGSIWFSVFIANGDLPAFRSMSYYESYVGNDYAYAHGNIEVTEAIPAPGPAPAPDKVEPNKGSNIQEEWLKDDDLWYFVNSRGKYQTGWLETAPNRSVRYYFNSNGVMQTGWVKDDGNWYFFAPSGAMKTGWVKDDGHWYYLGGNGAMKTGWLQHSGEWYYLWGSGAMATGTQTIGGQVSSFDSSGAWLGYK